MNMREKRKNVASRYARAALINIRMALKRTEEGRGRSSRSFDGTARRAALNNTTLILPAENNKRKTERDLTNGTRQSLANLVMAAPRVNGRTLRLSSCRRDGGRIALERASAV